MSRPVPGLLASLLLAHSHCVETLASTGMESPAFALGARFGRRLSVVETNPAERLSQPHLQLNHTGQLVAMAAEAATKGEAASAGAEAWAASHLSELMQERANIAERIAQIDHILDEEIGRKRQALTDAYEREIAKLEVRLRAVPARWQ